DITEAAQVARIVNAMPAEERRELEEIAEMSGIPRRKARIVLTLLKRHGMVREHRGGMWERLAPDVTAADLSRELIDYEERRKRDREKLEAMVRYCRTAKCRTRMILEYFGEEHPEDFRCGHCDNDADPDRNPDRGGHAPATVEVPAMVGESPATQPSEEQPHVLWAGEEVRHETFGEGIVLEINNDRAEVDFAGHGTRVVRLEFLERV
ncbi:MAG: RecQ family zinc-binding domain-containing protein, partial [Gemmatimonadetes bacterium]|nr:RecQ family zinc-binding domain-containing protein [Gemmatimonadota bacterium]